MPRVVNAAMALVLLLLVGPVVTHFAGKPGYVQVALALVVLPVLVVVVLCLCSAARPGSIGRAARRLRRRRRP